jgi:uncharacterized protein YprB with RNaseH-like and TPR domain
MSPRSAASLVERLVPTGWRSWTPEELALLRALRGKNVSYKKMVPHFPGRSEDSIRTKAWVEKIRAANGWTEGETFGFLDIETTALEANRGFMLSWCLRVNGKTHHDVIRPSEIRAGGVLDRRIHRSLMKALRKVDVIVTYNGWRFDLTFLRTRALMLGEEFHPFGSLLHVDVYPKVKYKLRLHRSSQRAACEALGIPIQTEVKLAVWMRANLGDPKAIAAVLEHNQEDVWALEQLFNALKPYIAINRNSI